MGMIKDLKQLARFSTVGITAVIIECTCIMGGGVLIWTGGGQDYSVGPVVPPSALPGAMGKYIATFLFSFAILGTVPSVRAQLAEPSQMHAILSRSFIILVCINCVVMGLGYLGFGSEAPDNVVVGLSKTYPWIGQVASVAVLVNVLLSSPLFIFCVVGAFEASGSGLRRVHRPLSLPNIGVRIGIITAMCLIGDQLPYVGDLIGIVSSVFAVFNNILWPAIFHYKARQLAGTTARHPTWRIIKYVSAVIVGVLVLVFGLQGSLNSLQTHLEEDRIKAQNKTASNALGVNIFVD